MKKTFLATIVIVGSFFTTVNAQQVNNTESQRIREGVKTGKLTRREAKELRAGQKDIHQDVKEARADGVVTKAERKEIRHDRQIESRKIYRKKHNLRVRH